MIRLNFPAVVPLSFVFMALCCIASAEDPWVKIHRECESLKSRRTMLLNIRKKVRDSEYALIETRDKDGKPRFEPRLRRPLETLIANARRISFADARKETNRRHTTNCVKLDSQIKSLNNSIAKAQADLARHGKQAEKYLEVDRKIRKEVMQLIDQKGVAHVKGPYRQAVQKEIQNIKRQIQQLTADNQFGKTTALLDQIDVLRIRIEIIDFETDS